MATTTTGSGDSYVGSVISIISKSEIRYQGLLFHINSNDSAIGLKHVRSFGTEGRKKDGPQVLPSDKVYDYIYFRGTDIKDLQVLSSAPVQSTPAILNDPAIIQLGFPGSTFQGSIDEPVQNVASWDSTPPPNANGNEDAMPTFWQGFNGPSGGVAHLQQQYLLQPPSGLVVSPYGQQQRQYSVMNASIPSVASNFPEFPCPLLPSFSTGSLNTTSTSIPSSALPPSLPTGSSTLLVSDEECLANNYPVALPIVTLSTSSSLVPLASSPVLDTKAVVPPIVEKPKSVLGSTSPYQSMSTSVPSVVGTSTSNHIEASIPTPVIPGQLLQVGPIKLSSSLSLQTAQKDIELVQTSTLESLSMDAKDAQAPIVPLPSPSPKKSNGADVRSYHRDRGHERGRRNGLHGTTLHANHSITSHVHGRENKLNRAVSHTHHNNRGHAGGRGKGLYGATSHTHLSYKGHAWLNAPSQHPHHGNRGGARGRENGISLSVVKFTEDFDFVAMNEKFNKDEVWGQIGKSNKAQSKEKGDTNKSDGHDIQNEDADGLTKVEIEPVYVKDDFFDSLSCNSQNRESRKGRVKPSEQMKLETEIFGGFLRNQGGRGGQGRGHGGWSQRTRYGRGYGHVGRDQQRAVWTHVT